MIQHIGITDGVMRPDVRLPMIATKDITAYAAGLLNGEPLAGHSVHNLLGPRNYSQQEAIGQAIGRPNLPYVPFSYDDAQKGMMGVGLSENVASLYIKMTRSLNEEKLMVHESRPNASTTPTTLEEFAQQVFAPAFRGATAGA